MENGVEHGVAIPGKSDVESPSDPAIPLLGAAPRARKSRTSSSRAPVFTAAGPTTAETWDQPLCPLVDGRINRDGPGTWGNDTSP